MHIDAVYTASHATAVNTASHATAVITASHAIAVSTASRGQHSHKFYSAHASAERIGDYATLAPRETGCHEALVRGAPRSLCSLGPVLSSDYGTRGHSYGHRVARRGARLQVPLHLAFVGSERVPLHRPS
jgi:hypothetical protein